MNFRQLCFFAKRISFVTLAAASCSSVASAAGEVIEIQGKNPWCSGPGTEITYTPEGEPNICGCAEGFDQLDPPNEEGEPVCGYDFDKEGRGPDGEDHDDGLPGTGAGSGPDTPPKPTPGQCQQLNRECLKNASQLAQLCRDNRTRFNHNELANGRPCHDQSLDDLLDGVEYRILWLTWSCTETDFFDINNVYTDDCRREAIRRGMARCQWGVDAQSASQGQASTVTRKFSSPIFENGGSSSKTTSLTVSTPFGMGSNQACMALGTEAVDQCTSDLSSCLAEASDDPSEIPFIAAQYPAVGAARPVTSGADSTLSGLEATSSLQPSSQNATGVFAPPSLDDLLRSQVDRRRLGLLDDNTAPGSKIFRSLSRQRLEMPMLYTERLRCLANWSAFLRRNAVSTTKMVEMHTALRGEQFMLQAEFYAETSIVEAVFAVDMRTGTVGSDALRELLKMYRSSDGLRRQIVIGHRLVELAANRILGATLAAEFLDSVWPGMMVFGFAAPFEPQPGLILVEGGELAPEDTSEPVDQ